MWNLIHVGCQAFLACQKMQTPIDDTKLSPLQPQQTMPVGMRDPGSFKPQTAFQHGAGGRSNSMPNPKARCLPTPRANNVANPAGQHTLSSPLNRASGPATRRGGRLPDIAAPLRKLAERRKASSWRRSTTAASPRASSLRSQSA